MMKRIIYTLVLLCATSILFSQEQYIQDYLLEANRGVRADAGEQRMYSQIVDIEIDHEGYYRIIPKILYNSGDEQLNESFYLTIRRRDINVAYGPIETNAGEYKVVEDDPGPRHTAWRDAGLFYLYKGTSTIEMHHYARISGEYPEFLNGPLNGPESVKVSDSLKVIARPQTDVSIRVQAKTLHTKIMDGQRVKLAYPGETIEYELLIKNQYINTARDGEIDHFFPDSVSISNYSIAPDYIGQEKQEWKLGEISPNDSMLITFTAKLPDIMPVGYTQLVDSALVTIPHDTNSINNVDYDSVFVFANQHGKKPRYADLALTTNVLTDTVFQANGILYKATLPGDTLDIQLAINNNGPDVAKDINVVNILPSDITLLSSTVLPTDVRNDSLFWTIDSIKTDNTFDINLSLVVPDSMPFYPYELENSATTICPYDTNLTNNMVNNTFYVLKPKIDEPDYIDLEITFQAISDTQITLNDNSSAQAVISGDLFYYKIMLENKSIKTAHNINLWNQIPDSITALNFNRLPDRQEKDSLFWYFDSLPGGIKQSIDFSAQVTDSFTVYPFPLTSRVGVICELDTNSTNNSDELVVYAIEKIIDPPMDYTDLVVELTSITNSQISIHGTSYNAVKPGEIFNYRIDVANLDLIPAKEARVVHYLPNDIDFQTATLPVTSTNDLIIWEIGDVEIGAKQTLLVTVKADSSINPQKTELLTSIVELSAENDANLNNNADIDTIAVTPIPSVDRNYDLALNYSAVTDTSININGQMHPAVFDKGNYLYQLEIQNNGPMTAYDVSIWNKVPSEIKLFAFNLLPNDQAGDTLFWNVDSVEANQKIKIQYGAEIISDIPYYPYPLEANAGLDAIDDTTAFNNYRDLFIYALAKGDKPGDVTDISINLFSQTDTTISYNGNIWNAVQPGQEFSYMIHIQNLGKSSGDQLVVHQVLPRKVEYLSSTFTPFSMNADSVIWHFDEIPDDSQINIPVKVKADQDLKKYQIISSQVYSSAKNDTLESNNVDSDSILIYQKQTGLSDLALNMEPKTATKKFLDGDSVFSIYTGDTLIYRVTVNNISPEVAKNIKVMHYLPDLQTIENIDVEPSINNDSLFWSFDSLASGKSWQANITLIFDKGFPYYPFEFEFDANVVAENDNKNENNRAAMLLYGFEKPNAFVDLSVSQLSLTDSIFVSDGDTISYIRPGEIYQHHIYVRNNSSFTAKDVQLTHQFPDSVRVSDISPNASLVEGHIITWMIDELAANQTKQFLFNGKLSTNMQPGEHQLYNVAAVHALNENVDKLENNTSMDTMFCSVQQTVFDWIPEIIARPSIAKVNDSIWTRVRVPVQIQSWDLWIHLPDGSIEMDFADQYISNHLLKPNIWYDIDKPYVLKTLLGDQKEEELVFEIKAVDQNGKQSSAKSTVVIKSNNYMVLDRNVYRPDYGKPLQIRFKLSSSRMAQLDVYDVSGRLITNIANSQFNGGWNTCTWDGMTNEGLKTGGGVYLITLRSADYNSWKKIIVVR